MSISGIPDSYIFAGYQTLKSSISICIEMYVSSKCPVYVCILSIYKGVVYGNSEFYKIFRLYAVVSPDVARILYRNAFVDIRAFV